MAAMEALLKLSSALQSNMSINDRVQVVASVVNTLIEEFDNGVIKEGVEAVQEKLIQALVDCKLAERDRWIDVMKAGVHPDNRDRAGLVPVDAHDLLDFIAERLRRKYDLL